MKSAKRGRGIKKFVALAAPLIFAVLGNSGGIARASDRAGDIDAVEAFGNLPAVGRAHLSPDGKYLALVRPIDGHDGVAVYDVDNPIARPASFAAANAVVRGAVWHDDEHLIVIYTAGSAQDDKLHTLSRASSFSPRSGKAVPLAGNVLQHTIYGGIIVDPGGPLSEYVYLPGFLRKMSPESLSSTRTEDAFTYSLFRVSVNTGEAEAIAEGTSNTQQWITDGEGHVLARMDEAHGADDVISYAGGEAHSIAHFSAAAGRESFVFGLAADGKGLAVVGPLGPTQGMTEIDPTTGATIATLFSDPHYDLDEPIVDEWTGRVIGASYMAERERHIYFDAARQAVQNLAEKHFPDLDVTLESATRTGNMFVVRVEGAEHPPQLYLYHADGGNFTDLGDDYPLLAGVTLSPRHEEVYTARDGTPIEAYLTLPQGRAAVRLPLVVLPHGGPEARDPVPFDWWAQYLAYRGYAVLQPNFRGSSGYGLAFAKAGDREWGAKMQDDLTDGVNKLVADGVVDPKRVCIAGASYGGYAALAGVTFTPDLYACAASIAGISDLPAFMDFENRRYNGDDAAMDYWGARIGTAADGDLLVRRSPDRYAANVRVPVLLLHGARDTTVAFEQSEMERDALAKANKNVTLVTLAGDDHYLSQSDSRKRVLSELDRFLAAHIGPGAPLTQPLNSGGIANNPSSPALTP